jgi:molybdopterin molybdotransferase
VAFVEIWPSLVNAAVRAATGPGDIRDAVQVRLMAGALAGLDPARLAAMLEVDAPEEGWIFGLGFEPDLHDLTGVTPCR